MNEEDVRVEVRSVFSVAMGHDRMFPFDFLQAAGEGSRSLVIPVQSTNFQWTGPQVARLADQKGTIYIIAKASLQDIIASLIPILNT